MRMFDAIYICALAAAPHNLRSASLQMCISARTIAACQYSLACTSFTEGKLCCGDQGFIPVNRPYPTPLLVKAKKIYYNTTQSLQYCLV